MLHKISLLLLAACLASCSHGPDVTACVSNPALSQFNCSDKHSNTSTLTDAQSANYVGYSPIDTQNLFNYCSARNTAGTAPPAFSSCISDPSLGGLNCSEAHCQINAAQNGVICLMDAPIFIAYAQTENYVLFSPSDSTTLLAYCNVTL